MTREDKPIIAICGKGGVGKTVLCALLSRALLDAEGLRPLLLVDADPVAGLTSAIGERGKIKTLGEVREQIIKTVKEGEDAKRKVADQLDYMVLEALAERDGYSLFAMGRNERKGCYCPVNSLLRDAIDIIAKPFPAVLIDAEAGIEQINRQVTRRVTRVVVVTDGSTRSAETLALITQMIDPARITAVANRCDEAPAGPLPGGVEYLGSLPEDALLRQFDRDGRPLWELPADNPAMHAVRAIARGLGFEGVPA